MSAEYKEYLSARGKKINSSPGDLVEHQQDSFYAHEPLKSTPFNGLYDTSNFQRNFQRSESPKKDMQTGSNLINDVVKFQPMSPLGTKIGNQSIEPSVKHSYQEGAQQNVVKQNDKIQRLLYVTPKPLDQSTHNYIPQKNENTRTNSAVIVKKNEPIRLPTQYYIGRTPQGTIQPINNHSIQNNGLQYQVQRNSSQNNIQNPQLLNNALLLNSNRIPAPRTQLSPSRVNIRFLNNNSNRIIQKTPPKIQQYVPIVANNRQIKVSQTVQNSRHLSNQYPSPRPLTPTIQPVITQQYLQPYQQQQLYQPKSQENILLSPKKYFQMQPSVLSLTSNSEISKEEFERMANQCRFLEQRCRELQSSEDKRDMIFLRKQNIRLHQQVIQLKNRERQIIKNSQNIVANVIEKYKESTLKEYALLLQRYHLQRRRER